MYRMINAIETPRDVIGRVARVMYHNVDVQENEGFLFSVDVTIHTGDDETGDICETILRTNDLGAAVDEAMQQAIYVVFTNLTV